MQQVRQPITPEKLIPILAVGETRKLLAACASKYFVVRTVRRGRRRVRWRLTTASMGAVGLLPEAPCAR
jgi:hypothetical protein